MPEACFVTGAHVDMKARLFQPARKGYSNPGEIVLVPGGAGLNMASACAALGLASRLVGPVGDDSNGSLLHETLRRRDIEDGLVTMASARTGIYQAVIEPDGNLLLGIADLALYDRVDFEWLRTHCGPGLDSARIWVLNANLSSRTLQALAEAAGDRLIAACTVSPAKAQRLRPILGRIGLLFSNLEEARSLCGDATLQAPQICNWLREHGVASGVISDGPQPVHWWHGESDGAVPSTAAIPIVDMVGGGDALAGGVLAMRMAGHCMEAAVMRGIAAARLTIAVPGPVREDLSHALLEVTLAGLQL